MREVSPAPNCQDCQVSMSNPLGLACVAHGGPTVRPSNWSKPIEWKEAFQYGHPLFYELTQAENRLHNEKNHDYAAGGSPLGNFERVGAILALYKGLDLSNPAVVALIYALKQVDAVLWGLSHDIQHKVEGYRDRLRDIAVYAKIVICILSDQGRAK